MYKKISLNRTIKLFVVFVSVAILFVTSILSTSISVSAATSSKFAAKSIVVTTKQAPLKKSYNVKSKTLVTIKKGTKLTVVIKSGKTWTKVKTSKGKIGYLKTATLKKYVAPYKGVKKYARITYYCACPSCNGCWSYWRNGTYATTTSSGKQLYNSSDYKWKYCAATPFVGNLGQTITVYFDGAWRKLKIVDRMGSSYGNRIDIFWPSHSGCYARGVHSNKTVYVK